MCQSCWTAYKAPESDDHDKVKAKAVQKKKRSPIAPISAKKAKELAEYRKLRDEYLSIHTTCEAQVQGVCQVRPVELHHLKPRAYHLCDTDVFMAVCRPCHQWIESNDEEARKLGLKINHL